MRSSAPHSPEPAVWVNALLAVVLVQAGPGSDAVASSHYIDADHARERAAVREAIGSAVSPCERAVRIHDYVRDRIAFGFTARFDDQRATFASCMPEHTPRVPLRTG